MCMTIHCIQSMVYISILQALNFALKICIYKNVSC